jgi:hypothetical protein
MGNCCFKTDKRQNGEGCGLVELEFAHNVAIVGFSKYIEQGNNRFTRLVQEYEARKSKYSLQKKKKTNT